MKQFIKDSIKKTCAVLHIDLTNNMKYDRLTKEVLKKHLNPNSNCIDIGCHKGEILDLFFQYAPNGTHVGFEPIPTMAELLKKKFQHKNAIIYQIALSDKKGTASFNFVENAPAYSGLQKRKYAVAEPKIEVIEVELERLDDVLSSEKNYHLIKIDVEGGEFDVLKGAVETIKKNKPLIIFECGLGASEFYGTTPEDLYDFFEKQSYGIYLLDAWLKSKKPMTKEEYVDNYRQNKDYYFVASHC